MKKLRLAVTWRSYLLETLQVCSLLTFLILGTPQSVRADDFYCSSGDVTCLVASINDANGLPGKHTIKLEPGIYGLQTGLLAITGLIQIEATADDPPTVIEQDQQAQVVSRILVATTGELTLSGLTIQRFSPRVTAALANLGVLSLQNCVVTDNLVDGGAIVNRGTLHLLRTIITDNSSGHTAGGIWNQAGGTALIEFSTIAHNRTDGSGGISNEGTMVIRNSSIVFNASGGTGFGGGIGNVGNLEIINSTIAKNLGNTPFRFVRQGGGIANSGGFVSITNSTIRGNEVRGDGPGGGIWNSSGTITLQNTILAGNTISIGVVTGFDCSGTVTSIGSNVFGDPSGCTVNLQPSDLTGEPGLGSLVGTEEEALPGQAYYPVLAGSPVIDNANPNACPQVDQLGNLRVGICDIGAVEFRGPILASVDIRPKSDANRINPNNNKNINVAILSVNGFDATKVDPKTIRFGATGTEAAPIHIATRDVDGNGSRDVIVRFQIQDTGIKCGDTSASLAGQIFSGLSFVGSSAIKTVQCGKQ